MKILTSAALAGLLALGNSAYAQETQMIAIFSHDNNGGQYALVSLKHSLTQTFGIRADAYKSTWDTNYNSTPGTGTSIGARYAAFMDFKLSDNATATFTLGASNYDRSVSPTTLSSPADSNEYGVFSAAEIYYGTAGGELNGLIEYDGSSKAKYASINYLFSLGNFKVGPAVNIVKQEDFQRNAVGLKGAYNLSEKVDLELSAYTANQKFNGGESDVEFIELGLITRF